MAEAGKDQDQSMEDILQSIKRIIAEEGDPVAPPPPADDVLELTEMLPEDSPTKAQAPVAELSLDEIMAAPVASPPPAPEPAPEPEAKQPELQPEPQPQPEPEPAPTMIVSSPVADEGLMSEATRVASMAALAALSETSMVSPVAPSTIAFRSGTTVEDLVRESLRPMLREWIDSHLPGIVETLVEREIRKLNRG
jgi:cell pole-organizing protein PopZ